MRIKLKNRINFDQADKLIEKYYEGFTTLEEERLLKYFLSQDNLPVKYHPEQAILSYFATKKHKPTFNLRPHIRWAGAAVAILVLAIGIQTYSLRNPRSFAYVDGVMITNSNEIKTQALASLSIVTAENYNVEQSFENLNGNELMQEQLDVFSGLSE